MLTDDGMAIIYPLSLLSALQIWENEKKSSADLACIGEGNGTVLIIPPV